MQRSVHRLHTLQDFFSNFPLCASNTWFALNISDWVKKSRIHQAKEESVWVLPDISRSYHRTSSAPHPIIFSCTETLSPCLYINSLCHIILESYQILSNHVRRLSRNLQEHIILNPSHLHDGLVISGNISLVGGLQDSHQESKPCKPPGPTTS